MKRDAYPPGVPCWIDATHPDAAAAAAFYSDILGWTYEDRMPGDAHYFVAQLDGLDAAGLRRGGVERLADVRVGRGAPTPRRTACREAGGTVTLAPQDVMDLGRTAVFTDPAGAPFAVWQPGRRAGLGVVNAPGSWNWSNLHTRDLDGAARFYGAVFGWEAADGRVRRRHGGDDVPAARLRRRSSPSATRASASATRAPARRPASPTRWPGSSRSRPDAPPRWHVTFSAADTDAVVARAAELGGEVARTRRSTPAPCAWPRCATRRAPPSA